MELVYLWVEEYKNIHNQGFNFSPRFECDYKDGNLIICDKKKNECEDNNYIENFFGDNINVTAIVGKNGSGKSSVLKLVLLLIFYQKYKISDEFKNQISFIKQNKSLFLIIHTKTGYKKVTLNISIISDKVIKEIDYKNIEFFTFYLNYMLDTLNDGFHDYWINLIYHKQDNYKTPLLIQPNKHDTNTLNDNINLHMIDFINKQRLLLLYKYINTNQNITNFFNPDNLIIKNDHIYNFSVNGSTPDETELGIINKVANKLNYLLVIKKKDYKLDNQKIPKEFRQIEDVKDYQYINLLYLVFKILTTDKKIFNTEKYNKLEIEILKMIKSNKLPTKDYLIEYDFKGMIAEIDNNDYRIKKILISIEFENNKIYDNPNFKLLMEENKIIIDDIQDILEYIPVWIDIIFYDGNKSLESLSSGEKSLFRIIIDIIYHITKIKQDYKSINIMLDETELGLHPQWQKEYLKYLLTAISNFSDNDFNINIIFATHSPFLLSDLPKENVIFLDTYENGNCKVIDGLRDKKQTFGANIHTLLSDSFFMDGGLMGEFAKGKIDKAITLLNQDKLEDKELKYCEQIISIIGEPIIKNQLQRRLDSKKINYLAKDTQEEIEFLKHRIDLLSKRK